MSCDPLVQEQGQLRQRPVPAKLTRPSARDVLPRNRLFKRMDAIEDTRCLWVAAPGGYGKTALASSWIEARRRPVVWYQCDAGDADIATFFHYLGEAARSAAPRRKQVLGPLTPEYAFGVEVFARRFFERLFATLGPGAVLVLDDYHEVAVDAVLHSVMSQLIATVPSGSRLIVLSRHEPPASLARWQADRSFVLLTAEDLSLTTSEARALARALPDCARADVESVNAFARGWTAGVLLLLRQGGDAVFEASERPTRVLFEYIAGEVFARIDASLQDFLIRTAWMPFVTTALAIALTGRDDAPLVLAGLCDRRYFTDRRSGQPALYEYHPLFRQFLQAHARSRLTAARLADLRSACAAALEAEGLPEAALALYLDAARWNDAARLMLAQAQSCMALGRLETLERWIERLPRAVRAELPWIDFWRGTCRTVVNPSEGRVVLEQTYAQFKAAADHEGCLVTWAGISESYFFAMGDFSGFARWVAEIERVLPTATEFPNQAIEVRVISGALGMLMHRPDHPAIALWAERALALIPQLPDTHSRVQLASFASIAWLWRGDLARAAQAWAACAIGSAEVRSSPLHQLMLEVNAGCLNWQLGEHAASRLCIERALALAVDSGIRVVDVWLHIQGLYCALSEGDTGLAHRHLASLQAITPPNRALDLAHIRFLHAGILLRQGELQQALAIAEPELLQAAALGAPFGLMTFRVQTAQMLMLARRHDEARALLVLAAAHADKMDSDITRFQVFLNLAWSLFDTGEDAAALEALSAGLAIGARRNYMNCHPWWIPHVMSRLLTRARAAAIEVDYVARLIRWRDVLPETADATDWPWPVRIRMLGGFGIDIDGSPLIFERKSQARPLELLKALVAWGGRGVRAEVLIEALWPDAEGDAGQRAWDVTLHRLRRLLGHHDVLTLGDAKLSLHPGRVWTDVWAFESFCKDLAGAVEHRKAECHALALELLRLYAGEFLAQERSQPWILQRRDRLRRDFQRSLLALGNALQQGGQWAQALEIYRAGIERDPLAEAFYQEAIRCLGHLGLGAEVALTYRALRDELARALGVQPSEQSRVLMAEFTIATPVRTTGRI
jgi:ATP/maltotriose-dependent transcriptional regulator MalT/DNA-binding SARP family transcriptional activator